MRGHYACAIHAVLPQATGNDLLFQKALLYLPTQIRFSIGGQRVTCRGLKLTNSLGRAKLTLSRNNNLNFRLARDQVVLL